MLSEVVDHFRALEQDPQCPERTDLLGRSPYGARRLGVWERDGRNIHPMFIFIDGTSTYRERLKFYAIAQETYSRIYKQLFNQALADAIATARL